jgi:ubiquitin carboxyl-terminal hydrolase 4/11/15
MVPSNVSPGPIDNRALLSDPNDHTTLYSFVQELQDFMLVPEAMWRHIHGWYGGGPAVPRVVVRRNYSRALAVDVHLHVIELLRSSALTADPIKLCTSKSAKVRHVREHGCKLFGLAETDVQLWDYHQRQKSKLLADLDATLAEENIIRNQFVLFEERGPDGRFPRSTAHARDFQTSVNATPGQCGLSNLGNTCFMNSALQCMSATAPLRRFFLSRQYEKDINKDNPLGCGGELALVFGELLDALWAGRYHSFAPREFKHQLERFAHQFQGYQQHDSQELLAFLLDGLHEDLNRVKKKPFVEAVEGCGRPDQVVADEAWEAHKKRNDSIVVDEFMGQLKSTVECDVCDRVSVTFDPFMYLSVPLPQVTTRTITVTLVRRDGSSPMRYAVTLEKDLNVGALKSGLSALCGIPVNCIVIADVFMSKIHADYEDHVPLTQISARDEIYGYEILSLSKPPPSKPPPAPPVGGGAVPLDVDAQPQQPPQQPPPPSDMVPLEEAATAEELRNAPTVPTRAQAAGFDDDGDDDGFGGGAKRAKPTAMKDSFDSDGDFTTPPPAAVAHYRGERQRCRSGVP